MNDSMKNGTTLSGGDLAKRAARYKREFWGAENLKFSEPWFRLQKAARILSKLAAGTECSLLDIGCGPGTLAKLLPANMAYCGVDIAIPTPAPNLMEADLLESVIGFHGRKFDIVSALGFFEYVGELQQQKFSEIATLLTDRGKFVVTYTNFRHRNARIFEAFSNVQQLEAFKRDLQRYFSVDKFFPASHNWKHSQPSRDIVKNANMHLNANIPLISRALAVDYFFICSPRSA
jgi:cyclopropane fatty-acyl-phospholipid synthase-like methyltransferase